MAPPLIDTSIVPEVPDVLYALFDYGLTKDGLIALANDDGRRKTYEITNIGEQALRMEYARLQAIIADSQILEGDGHA